MMNELPDATSVLCVLGPTASGKTGLAVELCQSYPFEIISVDSALIYRGMDIGTAKPDADTLRRAPHALVDIIDPSETCLLYTSPSPRDGLLSRMPSSA